MRRLLLGIAISLMMATTAGAATIRIEWEYTPPTEPAVVGFRLYKLSDPAQHVSAGGDASQYTFVHTFDDPDSVSGDCIAELDEPTTYFVLTAMFDDGTESPRSLPYAYTLGAAGKLRFVWLKPGNREVIMSKPGGVRLR